MYINFNSEYSAVYNNWGTALLDLAKLTNDWTKYKSEIDSLYIRAYELKNFNAAYNLSCLYSILDDKPQALKWLEIDLEQNSDKRTRSNYDTDSDFDNIKVAPEFIALLDKYYPKEAN